MVSESKVNRLIFAMGTSSPEEVPSGYSAEQLQEYHICSTALWSPRILGRLGFLPESRRCDSAGLDVENALLVIPDLVQSKIDQPLEERLVLAGNRLFYSQSRARKDIVDEICRLVDSQVADPPRSPIADGIEEDFFAFGYAVMQVQQMARKLRYSFNLDWMIVSDQLLQASEQFHQGNFEETQRWLDAAYDSLSQERDRYCSQQGYLLHLVLSAQSTLGERFSKEMQNEIPTSLLVTTESLSLLAESNPQAFHRVSERLAEKSISLIGGFSKELKHTYLSEQSLHRSFDRARSEADRLGIAFPKVLLPFFPSIPGHLPTLARLHGFHGAILAKFLDGMVPEKEHAKLKWQASADTAAIDTILGHLLDASDTAALLELGTAMAKQLDYHQVPTLLIAHWPDRTSVVFDDLVRCMRRTPALGKWVLADDYFESTSQPYWSDTFGTHQFPFSIPKQPDRIHSIQISLLQIHRNLYRLERLEDALACWSSTGNHPKDDSLRSEIQDLLCQIDGLATHGDSRIESPEQWSAELDSKVVALYRRATDSIRPWLGNPSTPMVLHPASHPRRLSALLDGSVVAQSGADSERILHHGQLHSDPTKSQVILDVPPFGFCAVGVASPGDSKPVLSTRRKGFFSKLLGHSDSIAQSDGSLANEFMEVQIDPKKGHLRSLFIRDQRGNRLSGMVCLVPKPAGEHHRAKESDSMSLSQVRLEHRNLSDHQSQIVTRGVFGTDPTLESAQANQRSIAQAGADQGLPWIEQTIRLDRGCKWVEVAFSGGGFDRFAHTPVWRMIWPSQAATLGMWSHGNRTKWLGPLQGCVELIEIDDAQHKVYYATGGLSYHHKPASNQIQSLLPIHPDGSIRAKLYLGIHWQRPWETAIDLFQEAWTMLPEIESGFGAQDVKTRHGTPKSGWLAQCNHSNLRFSFLPVLPPELPSTGGIADQGKVSGCVPGVYTNGQEVVHADALLWVCEGMGKASTAKISLPKSVRQAWKVDFCGHLLDKISSDGESLTVPYSAWEKCAIAVVFGSP